MITNSGSDRNSACWTEHEHAIKVAAGNRDAKDEDAYYLGEVIDDTMFSYVCALDPDDDPLEDPSCWPKANPMPGVTITEEYLAGVVAQAKNIPAKLNTILRLHFCVWTDAETAWKGLFWNLALLTSNRSNTTRRPYGSAATCRRIRTLPRSALW